MESISKGCKRSYVSVKTSQVFIERVLILYDFVISIKVNKGNLEMFLVVCDYSYVFPMDFPILLHDLNVEFCIDIVFEAALLNTGTTNQQCWRWWCISQTFSIIDLFDKNSKLGSPKLSVKKHNMVYMH